MFREDSANGTWTASIDDGLYPRPLSRAQGERCTVGRVEHCRTGAAER
jgi:hypothetical protein